MCILKHTFVCKGVSLKIHSAIDVKHYECVPSLDALPLEWIISDPGFIF